MIPIKLATICWVRSVRCARVGCEFFDFLLLFDIFLLPHKNLASRFYYEVQNLWGSAAVFLKPCESREKLVPLQVQPLVQQASYHPKSCKSSASKR